MRYFRILLLISCIFWLMEVPNFVSQDYLNCASDTWIIASLRGQFVETILFRVVVTLILKICELTFDYATEEIQLTEWVNRLGHRKNFSYVLRICGAYSYSLRITLPSRFCLYLRIFFLLRIISHFCRLKLTCHN